MNWKFETWKEYKARLSRYCEWFAWYPVSIDGRIYWLEKVLRRYKFSHSSNGDTKEVIYQRLGYDKLSK